MTKAEKLQEVLFWRLKIAYKQLKEARESKFLTCGERQAITEKINNDIILLNDILVNSECEYDFAKFYNGGK